MAWALINSSGVIQNLIVYNGTAAYTPEEGLTLQSVPDTARINDTFVNGVLTPAS